MFRVISILLIMLASCTMAMETPSYEGKFVSKKIRVSDGIEHTIQIEFISDEKCKIIVSYGPEIDDINVFRYRLKGNWVMIKNMSTGQWTKLKFENVDSETFKIQVYETDSVKTWRLFHKTNNVIENG